MRPNEILCSTVGCMVLLAATIARADAPPSNKSIQKTTGAAELPLVTQPSNESIQTAMKMAELRLVNISVEASSRTEVLDPKSGQWNQVSSSHVKAWYDGMPGGKTRIEFDNEEPWLNGPQKTSEEIFTAVYNGQLGTRLYTQLGTKASKDAPPTGWIDGKRQVIVNELGGIATGWQFSLYGLFDKVGEHASRLLDKSVPLPCTVTETQFEKRSCLELSEKTSDAESRWFFDPSRDYAVLGYEILSHGSLIERLTVQDFVQPVPGVFYPSKATLLTTQGGGQSRFIYQATQVTANAPSFSNDLFSIKWPAGTLVHNATTGAAFTVGAAAR